MVARPDHRGRCGVLVVQSGPPADPVAEAKDKEDLYGEGEGDHQHIKRFFHNHLALEDKQDDQGEQQGDDRHLARVSQEDLLEPLKPLAAD